LTLTPAVLRYAIADALVRNDLQTFDPTIIAFAAPLAELQVNRADYRPARKTSAAADWQKAEQRAKNDLAFIQYGECVVRANPNAARTLLSTKVNSEDEGAALIGLLPTFQGCLERGKEFSASRLILRGTIAFNYYRLAYGRRMPASTTPARQ
jgi:hypothetical protein